MLYRVRVGCPWRGHLAGGVPSADLPLNQIRIASRSLSDLSNHSEISGRASAYFLNLEAHSETMQ